VVVRWIVMKISRRGRRRNRREKLMIKYIEYNAIVVIILTVGGGEIGGGSIGNV